jgi:SAM-dependent methyltransferase
MLPEAGAGLAGSEGTKANPYAPASLEIIERHADGLILDSGAGMDRDIFPNVIQMDLVISGGTDIVADGLHLPFRDEVFDAVISESVIEHVMDPLRYVREIRRVLKEGGEVRVDAAFLQPFQACPDHYFNMTRSGLEILLQGFEKVQSGVGAHQEPWVALKALLSFFLASLENDDLRGRLGGMTIAELLRIAPPEEEGGFLRCLKIEEMEKIAAGVTFHGVKKVGRPTVPSRRPEVSLVVTPRGTPESMESCLVSVRDLGYTRDRLEVIVLDPGPVSRMDGARRARGDRIAFLDADCVVDPGWLDGLMAPLDGDAKVVCAASPILDGTGETLLHLPGAMDGHGRLLEPGPVPPVLPDGPALFPFAAAMIVERDVLLRSGGFDPTFRGSLDDLDLGWRLWVMGYEVRHAPGAPVRRTGESPILPARRITWAERGSLAAIYKNYDEENLRRILPEAILQTLERGWKHSRISPRSYEFGGPEEDEERTETIHPEHAACLVAVEEFIQGMDWIHARRQEIQAGRARPDEEILALLPEGGDA